MLDLVIELERREDHGGCLGPSRTSSRGVPCVGDPSLPGAKCTPLTAQIRSPILSSRPEAC
jgi:hypothetical protein